MYVLYSLPFALGLQADHTSVNQYNQQDGMFSKPGNRSWVVEPTRRSERCELFRQWPFTGKERKVRRVCGAWVAFGRWRVVVSSTT